MDSITHSNAPETGANNTIQQTETLGRNYGIGLGIITALYLIIINIVSGDNELSLSLRFAKHLLIIPVVWMAIATLAKSLPEGRIFKKELGLLLRIAAWGSITLALINILFFAVTSTSFEQFMQEGETILGVMINSGFLIFETLVFVMIIGFVILQAYKGKGSPED
ncbi:MAG: hypothetical protein AB8H12_01995 [Lewinella sp.]